MMEPGVAKHLFADAVYQQYKLAVFKRSDTSTRGSWQTARARLRSNARLALCGKIAQ